MAAGWHLEERTISRARVRGATCTSLSWVAWSRVALAPGRGLAALRTRGGLGGGFLMLGANDAHCGPERKLHRASALQSVRGGGAELHGITPWHQTTPPAPMPSTSQGLLT